MGGTIIPHNNGTEPPWIITRGIPSLWQPWFLFLVFHFVTRGDHKQGLFVFKKKKKTHLSSFPFLTAVQILRVGYLRWFFDMQIPKFALNSVMVHLRKPPLCRRTVNHQHIKCIRWRWCPHVPQVFFFQPTDASLVCMSLLAVISSCESTCSNLSKWLMASQNNRKVLSVAEAFFVSCSFCSRVTRKTEKTSLTGRKLLRG